MKQSFDTSTISKLPVTTGVYLFYNKQSILLYVGKSKNIRKRVHSHFSARDEQWFTKQIRHIETRPAAGELGALLLESQLIKELRPMYNVVAKQRRRIIIAKQVLNAQGYSTIALHAVDRIDVSLEKSILGIFKHKTQAKEFLAHAAKVHRLCPKLLKLESPKMYCFSYHLGRCNGACNGEEDPKSYNIRVERAFEERRIKAWPYRGPILVEEESKSCGRELFLIDNWCLLKNHASMEEEKYISQSEPYRFDYDSYKIIYAYLNGTKPKPKIYDASHLPELKAVEM